LTAEQLEAARAERMRQNGHGAITIEDVRTWIEETGLCIFLPRSAQAGQAALLTSPTAIPTFVEAVAGQRTNEPTLELIASAESLLVRLEAEGVAVRLNLAGLPGDQPDYVVAGWVLPYIYALRGDRDWRRSPQLTGSRQVSQLAVQAAKQLDSANMTATQIRDALGREVTEAAVLRALHELWKQLRIIPVVPQVGSPALWQPLRQRFQKAIAEGASTSQVTAISVLASIYLQAVIAASMEDVEMFLSPLTSRSKIREVVRGLAATRQVHSTTMGHSPMFYVAGTLPEFPAAPSFQISASLPGYRSSNYKGSAYLASYLGHPHDEDLADAALDSTPERVVPPAVAANHLAAHAAPVFVAQQDNAESIVAPIQSKPIKPIKPIDRPVVSSLRPVAGPVHAGKSQSSGKSAPPRPRATRNAGPAHPRERSRTASNSGDSRPSASSDRRRAPAPRGTAVSGNGTRSTGGSSRPVRNGNSSNGNGNHAAAKPAHSAANGNGHNGHGTSKAHGTTNSNGSKSANASWGARPASNGAGNRNGAKSSAGARPLAARGSSRTENRPGNRAGSPTGAGSNSRTASGYKSGPASVSRNANGNGARSDSRNGTAAARPTSAKRTAADSTSRKPAASAAKRYSFSGQAKQAPKPVSKSVSGRTKAAASSAVKSHSKPARPAASKRRG
jgi:23S rRNA pseudouridine2605 synthase